jgi:hypothetical protein
VIVGIDMRQIRHPFLEVLGDQTLALRMSQDGHDGTGNGKAHDEHCPFGRWFRVEDFN